MPVRILKVFARAHAEQATQYSHDVQKNNESACCSSYVRTDLMAGRWRKWKNDG
jgi:hypothetical protein